MTDRLLSRLAELDAAPRTEPTTADFDREERLLMTVLNDNQRPARSIGIAFRRPLVRRTVFTLGGGLAAGLAFVAVTGGLPGFRDAGPLSSSELATWTSTASELNASAHNDSAAEKWCLESTKDQGGSASPKVTNADVRGSVASMVITRGDDASYCLAGSDGGVSMVIDPVAKAPADGITLDTLGARGNDSAEFNYALGSVGSDVKNIVVRDHGRTVTATVQDGRWTAWWPDGSPDGLISGNITLTLTDGTTRTVTDDDLLN